MTVRRYRHVQPWMLSALAVVLCALIAGLPTSQTQGFAAFNPSKALVLASAYHGDINVVSRLEGSTGGEHLDRADLLAEHGNAAPTSEPSVTGPRWAEQAIGLDVADVPRARAPPHEEVT
jgi:hypothetical protein